MKTTERATIEETPEVADRSRIMEKTYRWGKWNKLHTWCGRIRWEYLKNHRRGEYIRLLMDGKLNEHLHEIDEACYERMELLVERRKLY